MLLSFSCYSPFVFFLNPIRFIYRRCKRCIRGHIKCVSESCVLAQEPEKLQQQAANKGKAKKKRTDRERQREAGDNRKHQSLVERN